MVEEVAVDAKWFETL